VRRVVCNKTIRVAKIEMIVLAGKISNVVQYNGSNCMTRTVGAKVDQSRGKQPRLYAKVFKYREIKGLIYVQS